MRISKFHYVICALQAYLLFIVQQICYSQYTLKINLLCILYVVCFSIIATKASSQVDSPNEQFLIEDGYQTFNFDGQIYRIEVDSSGNLRIIPNSLTNQEYIIFDDESLDIEMYDQSIVYGSSGSNNGVPFDLNSVPMSQLRQDRLEWKSPPNFIVENAVDTNETYGGHIMGIGRVSQSDATVNDLVIYNQTGTPDILLNGSEPFLVDGIVGGITLRTVNGAIDLNPNRITFNGSSADSQVNVNGSMSVRGIVSFNNDINSDLVPFSTAHDLGNDNSSEHWDNVVADNFITRSDSRMKKNINAVTSALKDVMNLNPVKYQYTEKHSANDKVRHGFIAQEVQKILPELVVTEDVDIDKSGKLIRIPNEYLSLNYLEFIPLLTKAIQEQQEIIDSQSKLIAALSTQNAAILRRLDQLEK